MECNGIFYTIRKETWNIQVPVFEFALHLNNLLKSLRKDEQIDLIKLYLQEPIKERAGVVYKDLKEVKLFYDTNNQLNDILIVNKDGTISFKSIFDDIPEVFIFYDVESLERFSLMESSSEYEAIDIMFTTKCVNRISIVKKGIDWK